MPVYPGDQWETATPEEAGIDQEGLDGVRAWLDERVDDRRYRFAVVKAGKLVVDWSQGVDPSQKLSVASTWKSMLSNVLGMIVEEGKLPSADAEVYDYWPVYMDVPDGEGPKENRYAFPKDRHITFRQLISNSSGYMKPGEEPGTVFHYQSYGMCILSHALASLYGYYDIEDPVGSDGFARLLREKLADPLGVEWTYSASPLDNLHDKARQNIFSYGTRIQTTALDLARAGWLWCNYGKWGDTQLVPEGWMRDSTRVAPQINEHCGEKDWLYGNGVWSNSEGRLWRDLPREGFHSWGAGGHYVVVFPEQELVIVQNPDPFGVRGGECANPELITLTYEACVGSSA